METPQTPTGDPNERIERLERELSESRESEKYWAGLARGTQPAEEAEPEPEEEDGSEFYDASADTPAIEGDTPEKLIDEFAAEGVAALSKRGFITAKDAQKIAVQTALKVTQSMIGRERQKMTTDTQITGEFPELLDQNSDLFKETARIYQRAVAMDPNAKKTPAALYLAAQAAQSNLHRRPSQDDGQEPEDERRQRAASQDARPRGRGTAEPYDDMLGEDARTIIRQMGISEQEFRDSQKSTARATRRTR